MVLPENTEAAPRSARRLSWAIYGHRPGSSGSTLSSLPSDPSSFFSLSRKSAHLTQHRARVSLAEAAGKDTMARKVDQDVAALRDQMARDEKEADPRAPPNSNPEEFDDDDGDDIGSSKALFSLSTPDSSDVIPG